MYIYEGGYLTCRRRLAGIYKVTTPRGIRVVLMDVHAVTDIDLVLNFWKPDGIVAEGDALKPGWAALFARRKIPTVLCGPAPDAAGALAIAYTHLAAADPLKAHLFRERKFI